MKNNYLALILSVLVLVSCKPKPSGPTEEERAEQARKEMEVKLRKSFTEFFTGDSSTVDTVAIKLVDSATERTENMLRCLLIDRRKKDIDRLVGLQEKVVDAAMKVSPMLAESDKLELDHLKIKQLKLQLMLDGCMDKTNGVDSVKFKYYLVDVEAIRSTKDGKDTITGQYLVDTTWKVYMPEIED